MTNSVSCEWVVSLWLQALSVQSFVRQEEEEQMDPKRFDQISKSLATGTSRRTFVKGLSGGMLAGALALAGRSRAEAKADKVGICHYTGSASNPIVQISVAANAVPAHLAHGDTILGTTDDCGFCGDVCVSEDACYTAYCGSGSCGLAAVEPINCVVSEWGEWSECSAPCDGGTTTRVRAITTEASCGGACLDELSETEACNEQACPSDELCEKGYEAVNGGCFQIVSGLDESKCFNQCHVYGSVIDSGNFLCATETAPTDCSSTSDCAPGNACYHFSNGTNSCIKPC